MTRAAGAAAAGLALAAWPLLAQQTTPTFRTTAEMVAIYATVLDHDGHLVSGLQASDFAILDNGQLRDVVAFSNETQPTTVSLLLDRSGSTNLKDRDIRDAARVFVGDLLPEDRASVSTLSWDCEPLTTDHARLIRAIDHDLRGDHGSPIWRALDRLMTRLDQELGRRAVLILSDGMDTSNGAPDPGSTPPCQWAKMLDDVSPEQVIAHARQEGMLIYAVVVPTPGSDDTKLRQIVKSSGGESYVMKPKSDLTAAFRAIADELHHQYLLGFVPAVFDDEIHSLDVKVKTPGMTVRARKSYIASRVGAHGAGAEAIAFAARTPWPAISDKDVRAAIDSGGVGRTLAAACSAAREFGSPIETMTSVDVVAEGPAGRIMRAAYAAKGAIDVAGLSPALRAPTVTVTATRPACTNHGCPSDLTAIEVHGHGRQPIVLTPLAPPAVSPDGTRIVATYAMADFKALPSNEVDVVVSARAGDRKCRFAPADVAAIR